jgi:hypothetical protein
MDAAHRSPLLEQFRRGGVSYEVRMLAAQGALAPRAGEQLELLVLLAGDGEPEIAATAEATLSRLPVEALRAFLARSDASPEVRAFFAARGVEAAGPAAREAEAPLIDTTGEDEERAEAGSLVERIAGMSVPQRIALAMKGSREARAILVRDPNRLVAAAVLSSPKLTDSEVEAIARMASVHEDVLRAIASTRAWIKNYGVTVALVRNPKTPLPVSMNLLARLTERDVRTVAGDRNVPDVLRMAARKKLVLDA